MPYHTTSFHSIPYRTGHQTQATDYYIKRPTHKKAKRYKSASTAQPISVHRSHSFKYIHSFLYYRGHIPSIIVYRHSRFNFVVFIHSFIHCHHSSSSSFKSPKQSEQAPKCVPTQNQKSKLQKKGDRAQRVHFNKKACDQGATTYLHFWWSRASKTGHKLHRTESGYLILRRTE